MLEIIYLIFIFYFEQPTKSQKFFVHHYFSTWLTFLKKENTRKEYPNNCSRIGTYATVSRFFIFVDF
jgi:hypothetical protein